MRLASNKDAINKQRVASLKNAGVLSVRSAARLIPPTAAALKAAATRAAKKAEKIEAELRRAKAEAGADPVEQLPSDIDPGEVLNKLLRIWDDEKFDRFIELYNLEKQTRPDGEHDLDVRNTPFDRTHEQSPNP
jgi:hypothetical protein